MTLFNRVPGRCLMLAGVLGLIVPPAMADEHRVTGEAPGAFVVEDGEVDPATYEGYIAYTRACMACHGPDGLGSSFAPNLIRAAERRGWADFAGTIAAGRSVQPGLVMPSFADDPYVLANMENIFSYMRARGEGGLGRGRPQIIESMQEEAEALQEETEALQEETEALQEETEALQEETEALQEEAESDEAVHD